MCCVLNLIEYISRLHCVGLLGCHAAYVAAADIAIRPNAAFKTVRVSGRFGCLDLKLVGRCFEHSVGSEFSLGVTCGK